MPARSPKTPRKTLAVPPDLVPRLAELLHAYQEARGRRKPVWEFAVELDTRAPRQDHPQQEQGR